MKKFWISTAVMTFAAMIFFSGCDSRNAINHTKPPVSFQMELTAVKDLSQAEDLVDIQFRRSSLPFSDAIIIVNQDTIRSAGSGIYSAQSPFVALFSGSNSVTFESPDDIYSQTIAFELPDAFQITAVNPQYNQSATDVTVQWSRPNRTSGFILAVVSDGYPGDDTAPLSILLSATETSYDIVDTTFETSTGEVQPGIYHIYMIAYNGSFGPYPGIPFDLPPGIPLRTITEPSGHLRVGTVAPVDSIIIPL
jgi:hypothetical protein